MSESLERIERAFAGGVILAPAETDRLVEQVTARHFTEWRWGTIYDAAIRVYHQHPALAGDVSAVIAQLGADGELDRVGGSVAVLDLVHDACVGGSVSWYARRILDAASLRQLGIAGMRIQQAVAANPTPTEVDDTEALHRFAWEQVETALVRGSERAIRPIGDVFDEWLQHTEVPTIPIGFPGLAHEADITGAHPGHLMLIAARPATGKSTALAQAAVTAATAGHGVLFVTLEMTSREVLERCLANHTSTPLNQLRAERLAALPEELRPIQVVDAAMSVSDIAAAIRLSRRGPHPIEMVLVDYLQLLTPPSGTSENRQTEVAAISRALKRLAIEERVAVIAASQLNRASEARAERRPTLADLRESGQLEADSDAVILLHRDLDLPQNLWLIVAKNRHGRCGETSTLALYDRSTLASFVAPART